MKGNRKFAVQALSLFKGKDIPIESIKGLRNASAEAPDLGFSREDAYNILLFNGFKMGY